MYSKKSNLIKNLKKFENPTKFLNVVNSKISQKNAMFGDRKNSQCTAMAVTALVYSKYKEVDKWTTKDMDSIMLLGDKMYLLSQKEFIEKYGKNAPIHLAADEVSDTFTLYNMHFNVFYDNSAYQGYFQADFSNVLKLFFTKCNMGVLTCNTMSIALFCTTRNNSTIYYIFDSHSCSDKTCKHIENGVAILASFENIDEVVTLVHYNFFGRFNMTADILFTICPCGVTQIKHARKRLSVPLTNQERIKKARLDDEFRKNESSKKLENLKNLLTNPILKSQETERIKNVMKKLRKNPLFRSQEAQRSSELMTKLRKNPEFRSQEALKDLEKKQELRKDPLFRSQESRKETERKKLLRKNNKIARANERRIDAETKRIIRDNDILKHREAFYNTVRSSRSAQNVEKLKFLHHRKLMPDAICFSCEGLFFPHSIKIFDITKLKKPLNDNVLIKLLENKTKESVCSTCHRYILKGLLPKLAVCNGLQYVNIPPTLKELSSLEERMVSPYINFMQIRPLKPFAINPQLGLKGSVINISVEISDMITVLPRSFSDMHTVQIKLKRHMDHKTDYMFETIRPAVICDALSYLKDTPLYKKNNITVEADFFNRYDKNYQHKIDFVVDNDDIDTNELESSKIDIDNHSSSSDNENSSDEEIEEHTSGNDEVLIVNRNEAVTDSIKIIAPGQGKQPVPWHMLPDIDELCFPSIYCGHPFNTNNISYTERIKSEIRRKDRRSCQPKRLLFMAKKKLEVTCISNINICLRKTKTNDEISARNALSSDYINNLIKIDDGYRFLKQVRSSPAYWEEKKKQLLATIRQLGKPTIFLTLSSAETVWLELIQCLSKLIDNKQISLLEAATMNTFNKTRLISSDPVTCARYFDYKVAKFMAFLKNKNGVFENYYVEDSYERVEFQLRGSPHEHILLWLKNAPSYDIEKPNTMTDCINFIDQFTTCHYDENDPYVRVQMHKHNQTCYKGKKSEKVCRFNYPVPVMPRTTILEPLSKENKTDDMKSNFKSIKGLMNEYYNKKPVLVDFSEVLQTLNLSEEEYILAIRSSLKRSQVFLKRNTLEVGINSYNKDILHMFECNMDIQFVLEEYALASYIINYISKIDAGLSKLMRETEADLKKGNTSIKDKLKKFANTFINSNLMSAQEAVYHVLSLPLSKNSRKVVYINTSPKAVRVQMLKLKKDLEQLDPDSKDVFMTNIFSKYSNRSAFKENLCLADFVAFYSNNRAITEDENDDGDVDAVRVEQRRKARVIRYRRYELQKDESNYYREQILLFLPWRNEPEIENCNCKDIYTNNLQEIQNNRAKYVTIVDEVFDKALEDAQKAKENQDNSEIEKFENDKLSPLEKVDIMQQAGQEVYKTGNMCRHTCPSRVSTEDLHGILRELNVKQKQFVIYLLHCFKAGKMPINIFLSGSAGVGKSTVIRAIYQLITHYFDTQPGANKNDIVVLLCAPSGKAAFLINGVTLHTAFALPVSQFGGQMPELSSDVANKIRVALFNVKLIIIDEVSMVGSRLFTNVDIRLRQIRGINEPFGGISVLTVGDLNQLPPVMDSQIFLPPKINELSVFVSVSPLWELFSYYELTEIMRQKEEKDFIICLNNLAAGKMTDADIKLIRSREVTEDNVSPDAIRLYADNASVREYNDLKISSVSGNEYTVLASDAVIGKVSDNVKNKVLNGLQSKPINETGGYPTELRLKIGIKYMITANIDVEDGLVNGSCGVLKHISFCDGNPTKVWLDFNSKKVGNKARNQYKNYMETEKISNSLTPILKALHVVNLSKNCEYQVNRKQFPLTPAEALTIHKGQGQTYQNICIDFTRSTRITRQMLYVALSRVTKLSGLHILGKFKVPSPPKANDATICEINRLRTEMLLHMPFYNNESPKSTIKIAYHNVGSLRKHLPDIISDIWYTTAEILIFAETLLNKNDIIDVPKFFCLFEKRSDYTCRGISVYVNNNIKSIVTKISDHVICGQKYRIDLLLLKVEEFYIITGYKSPSTPNSVFKSCFNDALNYLAKNNINDFTLIGDFNFNIKSNENTFFVNEMENNKLKSALHPDSITTDHNTHIDVIFSNLKIMEGQIYESYFSYHKPICFYIKLNKLILDEGSEDMKKQGEPDLNCSDVCFISSSLSHKSIDETEIPMEIENYVDKKIILPGTFNFVSEISLKKAPIRDLPEGKINLILDAGGYLDDEIIDTFQNILAYQTANRFSPQSSLRWQLPQLIQPHPQGQENIQILFGGISSLDTVHNQIGHWKCSYYDGKGTVHIYDSLNSKFLDNINNIYLSKLYNFPTKVEFDNVQQQHDAIICGVYAIAFAVSLALGKNPQNENYIRSMLRLTAAEIIRTKTLIPFPCE